MDIERETIVEAGVSFVGVLVFVAAIVVVGNMYATNGTISSAGGLAIVGSIVLFIFVMTLIGLWFAYQE